MTNTPTVLLQAEVFVHHCHCAAQAKAAVFRSAHDVARVAGRVVTLDHVELFTGAHAARHVDHAVERRDAEVTGSGLPEAEHDAPRPRQRVERADPVEVPANRRNDSDSKLVMKRHSVFPAFLLGRASIWNGSDICLQKLVYQKKSACSHLWGVVCPTI